MNDILIHSPFSRQSSQGNSVTADRLEKILSESGFSVVMGTGTDQVSAARCLIALNARRSAQVVASFQSQYPGQPVIVILTGTDINHPEMQDSDSPTRKTMEVADALVALHEAELESVPMSLRGKTHVIYPSVRLPVGLHHQASHSSPLRVVMAGNIRPEKNTLLAAEACSILGETVDVKIDSYGEATGDTAEEMRRASRQIGNFCWHGRLPHADLLKKMQYAHLLLNTSTQEGGANAICEAVCLGLPVLASRIKGNIGMLGETYSGFFPSEDAQALASLLSRCATDAEYYDSLKKQIIARAPLFSYENEFKAWVALVNSMLL